MKRQHPEITWENVYAMHELYKPTQAKLDAHEVAKAFFPLVLFFWRRKPGKQRKLRNPKSADMNNYSIRMYLCEGPGSFKGIMRNAKAKGFPHLVAAFSFRKDHAEACKVSNRILSRKFKSWEEVRLIEYRDHPHFEDLIDSLKSQYPCTATGQTQMF